MKTTFSGTYNTVPADVFTQTKYSASIEDRAWACEQADKVVSKLAALKIKVEEIRFTMGATTTTLYLTLAPEVRMSRFKNVEDDLSVSLGLKCRVIAPIPNAAGVAVEIPTKNRTTVGFGQVYGSGKGELPISLGIKPDGEVLGFDLAKMPHLLIAGASGQGKSVGLNVIIMSLLSSMHPKDLNLYLIDPKRVEFTDYEALEATRMLKRIDTDVEGAQETLRELCAEMDTRYTKMQETGARKLADYNAKAGESLPYVVCIIDEFSDLMMSGDGRNRDVENNIIRIAQLGRAAGVHLIIATQRPDADVITGLIKANFPARIAFRTSTSIDSKIILDRGGAQQLIGNGDMLMTVNGETTRAQCAYVSDGEIRDAIFHCIQQLDTMEITDVLPAREATLAEVLKEAINPTTSPERLDALSFHELPHVRRSVAKNVTTPVVALRRLCLDEDQSVRYNVVANLNATDDIIKTLRRDACEDIRRAAQRRTV